GFRVAKRATSTIHVDQDGVYEASHDGYKNIGIIHCRKFRFEKDSIFIHDAMGVDRKSASAYFHFSPSTEVSLEGKVLTLNNNVICRFEGAESIRLETYKFSDQFNLYHDATRVIVEFHTSLETSITIP